MRRKNVPAQEDTLRLPARVFEYWCRRRELVHIIISILPRASIETPEQDGARRSSAASVTTRFAAVLLPMMLARHIFARAARSFARELSHKLPVKIISGRYRGSAITRARLNNIAWSGSHTRRS